LKLSNGGEFFVKKFDNDIINDEKIANNEVYDNGKLKSDTDKKPNNLKAPGNPDRVKSLKSIETFNMKANKADMKNSLSFEEIRDIDSDFMPQEMPKEAKVAQRWYSEESDIFNNFFRNYDKFLKKLSELNISKKEVIDGINDLKKSIVLTKKEYIVYRGIGGKFDVNRFNKSGGFISTTFDKAIACGYTRGNGEVITIKVPKGTSLMYIRTNSIYPNHMEILIPDTYYLKPLNVKGKVEYHVTKRNIKKSTLST